MMEAALARAPGRSDPQVTPARAPGRRPPPQVTPARAPGRSAPSTGDGVCPLPPAPCPGPSLQW